MSWKWIPWKKRIHQRPEGDRIEWERERHETILAAINGIADKLEAYYLRQDAENSRKDSRERWTLIGLLVTAGAAAIGIVLTACQIHATHESLVLDQRAWLTVKGFGPAPEIGKPWDLRVTFTNTGKTPAKRVHIACTVDVFPDEASIKWQFPTFQRPNLTSPGGEVICDLHPINPQQAPMTQALADMLTKTTLFVYGAVVYQDIFNNWHWLTFCSFMTEGGQSFSACKGGNDTGGGNTPPPPFNGVPKPS